MKQHLEEVISKVTSIGIDKFEVIPQENPEFGDYSTNISFALGKQTGKKPLEIAQELIDKIMPDLSEVIDRAEIAGQGFINFFVKDRYLLENVSAVFQEKDQYGGSREGEGKTIVLDYSSPNIAKKFGIGHLRSTIIGQALYNLFSYQGYKVIGDNHIGDWGTQFGTLLYQIKTKNLNPKDLSIDDFEKLYVDFHSELENNPHLKEEAKKWFKKLEENDTEAIEIWKATIAVSLKEFDRIYSLLNIKIDNSFGESFYKDKMNEVVDEIKDKGLLTESEGAMVVLMPKISKNPAMVLKNDGATTYLTRDLATIKYRINTWSPEQIIYEVGSDQILHFRQLFELANILGWTKETKLVHIAHGLIRYKEGKMSTRKGTTIKLEEVLSEAVKRAYSLIQKSAITHIDSKEEKDKTAKSIGINAIKYFDLMHNPTSEIIFDWDKILVLEGNSGPYIQYTYARTQSVLNKAIREFDKLESNVELEIEEREVVKHLSQFSEQIVNATKMYSPSIMCEYLYKLAQKYNTFYNKHTIIGSEKESFRLQITSATGQVLKNGLLLLGIDVLEKM